jgi:hypothetical protein
MYSSDDVLGFTAGDADGHFRGFVSCGASGEGGAFGSGNDFRSESPPGLELDAMAMVNQTVQDCVRQSRFTKIGMPFVHGELTA